MMPLRVWIDNVALRMSIRSQGDEWIVAPVFRPIVGTWELAEIFLAVFEQDLPHDPVLSAYDYSGMCRWTRCPHELPLPIDGHGGYYVSATAEGTLLLNAGGASCRIVDPSVPTFGPWAGP